MPTVSAYLSVPVERAGGAERAAIHVPLAELRARMHPFDVQRLSFYGPGRTPLPHRLLDTDGDGTADAALLVMPIAADGSSRLVAVCPGAPAEELADTLPPDGVTLRFDRARR